MQHSNTEILRSEKRVVMIMDDLDFMWVHTAMHQWASDQIGLATDDMERSHWRDWFQAFDNKVAALYPKPQKSL